MLTVAVCLGLRVNEILAVQWRDFDFAAGTVKVQREVVHNRIPTVKTEYSEHDLLLDSLSLLGSSIGSKWLEDAEG